MRLHALIRRTSVAPVLAAGIAVLAAGCGGSSGSGSGSSSSPPASPPASSPSSSAPAGGLSGTAATIASNWVKFFASSTPVSQRVSLLQNGSEFASVISAQAKSPLASSASAKVNGVSDVTSTQAAVNYTIEVGGQSALPNQTGLAVNQDGTWKVGDKSFCGLLVLENGKNVPAACKSAG